MRRWSLVLLVCAVVLSLGCTEERRSTPLAPHDDSQTEIGTSAEGLARTFVNEAGWEYAEDPSASGKDDRERQVACPLVSFERQPVVGPIVHYSARIRVGPGEHDLIGLHRVVREARPFQPIRTRRAVFMEHGGGKDFVGNMLPGLDSPRAPDDFGIAVYLAQNDVDVWGIDHGYALLASGLADFTFMADWGLQRHVDDLRIAIEIARVARRMTGNGYRKILVSGFSAGAVITYCLLNEETQLPPGHRQISGFIPVDYGLKTDNEIIHEVTCADLEAKLAMIEQGIYGWEDNSYQLGLLARDDPHGDSPVMPGLTNLQVLLTISASPFFALPGHFWAGVFDENGIAHDLQYSPVDRVVDFWITFTRVAQPVLMELEGNRLWCPTQESPWDDHLGEVTVPILRVAAAGGFGPYYDRTLDLVGSDDITRLDVRLHPEEEVLLDFGHVDLYTADNARDLFWQPMLEWIATHAQ